MLICDARTPAQASNLDQGVHTDREEQRGAEEEEESEHFIFICKLSKSSCIPKPTMHDFCFTYPYGFAVLFGGLIGFLKKGSTSSLLGGVGSGLLLLLASYVSHQAFLKGSKSAFALLLETVVALALTWVMGQRFMATGKFMPAGMVAAMSGIMALFYLYKVATGGNHVVEKQA